MTRMCTSHGQSCQINSCREGLGTSPLLHFCNLIFSSGDECYGIASFIGQVAGRPERRDGLWRFSIWNTKEGRGINCISSARFEAENCDLPLKLRPLDEVEVIGEVAVAGTCSFDFVNVLHTNLPKSQ